MVTARSAELTRLAERVAAALPPAAEDVVLTGSTSRGVADELSDIELLVVCETIPSLDECLAATGATRHWTLDGTFWWTGGTRDGEGVEAVWWPRARVEQRIADILDAAVWDHGRVRTAEALVHGIALRGDRLADWQRRLADYPEALAARIVDDAAENWHESARSELSVQRDALTLARRLVEDAENVLRMIFALNRAWEPGWKRKHESVAPLALKPDRTAERIDEAIAAQDLRLMRELVRDTLALAPDTPSVVRARREIEAFLA